MEKFFITSIGTGIGKTLVTTALCRQLLALGKEVIALKPVISGYDGADRESDTALIINSLGLEPTPENINRISPLRFSAPLSPDMAAGREGRCIVFSDVVAYCRSYEKSQADILLAEGVGGVMVPLNSEYTVLDWMEALDWKIILVTGSYLGAISHTLTALQALATRGLKPWALVISESAGSGVSLSDTLATLGNFLPGDIPVITIPRKEGVMEMDSRDIAERVPPLNAIWR